MRTERRRLLLLLPAAALLAAVLLAVVYAGLRAQRTLNRSQTETREAALLPYVLRPLDPESLRAANPGFEPIGASTSWTSGAQLGGDLYLGGPAGLAQYTAGTQVHLWRTGLELPTSGITAITSGRLRASSEPQILIATAGDGVLLLTPGPHPVFQQLLPTTASTRDLTALLVTSTGDLLLGTRNAGLLTFSGDAVIPVPMHLPGVESATLQITSLASLGPATLIGTRNGGAIYLRAGTAEHLTSANGLPDDDIESLAMTPTHAYLGTPVGIAELDLTNARILRILAPGLFAHTLAVSGGTLTVGTLDQGLRQIPLAPQPRLRLASFTSPAGEQARVEQVFAGTDGLLALMGSEVLRASGSDWEPVLHSSSNALTDPNVSALTLAPDGQLWVGLFDRGLDILDPATLTRTRHLEDDHLFCINRLVVDPARHTVAAATANGLVLFDSSGTPRQTLTRRDGLIADHINDLAFTPAGLAVATPAGITFLDPSGPESLYAFQGLVNNHVYTLALSPNGGQLLAGTLGGLSLLESEQVRRTLTATNSPLRHNWITAAVPEGPSAWLIGTYGAGLEHARVSATGQVSITSVDLPADAPHDLVINPNALLVTPTAVYAGTLGHGILVYSKASGRTTVVTQGLPSLNVTAFAAGAGTLYVGTENGLVRIAEARLAGGPR